MTPGAKPVPHRRLPRAGGAGLVVGLACMWVLTAATVGAQVVAPGGRTLFNRGVLVRSLLRFDRFDEPPGQGGLRRLTYANALVWGARPHLSLSFVTPVVSVERPDPADPDNDLTRTGTGDTRILARYDALRRYVQAGYTRLAPELGVKLPTGGAFGTGSTDLLGALVFSHVRDPHWLVADVQFTWARSGDGGLRQGNRWRYDLAYLYRLLPRARLGTPSLLLVLELNGETAERSRQDGEFLADSGGEVLFLSPGVEYLLSKRVVLEASVPVRIDADLDGTQPRPDTSLVLGARWLF